MSKITDYGALAAAAVQPDDVLPIVDTHDFTQAGTGTTKKITVANLQTGRNLVTWYGADPTGVADSTTAFQNCMNAVVGTGSARAQEMLIPPGTYNLNTGQLAITGPMRMRGLGAANGYNSAVTGAVSTLPGVTLNCNNSTNLFNMPSQGYLWGGLEMSNLNINYTGTGNVFDSVNFADSAFRDMTITLTQAGSMVMTCSGSNSVLNVIHERCTFVTTSATRTQPMFSIVSSIGAGISNNTFFKCKFSNAGKDNTQFMIYFACSGTGSAYHVADNLIECWFEHAYGGVYRSLSGSNIKIDGCISWDTQGGSPLMGNSLYYFGAYSGNSGSQGVVISACGRNLNGPDGTATNKWDVECEATTSWVEIHNYFTTPLAGSPPSTYNIFYNFHACQDVLVTTSQSPQGSSANGNSTTVITNPSPNQVVIGAGNILVAGGTALGSGSGVLSVGNAATAPTGTPAGGGILYGAGGQPLWLDTAGKFWNLAQDDTFSAQDAGLLAWNYDPADIGTAIGATSGTIQAIRINIRRPMSVTNVILFQNAFGTGLVSSQNFAGLWDNTGARIGITADQTTNWGSGGPVFKTMALAGGPFTVNPPWVWLLALSNQTAGGTPTWGRKQNFSNSSANAGLGVNNSRWATGVTTGQTALPAGSITPSSFFAAAQLEFWGGIS